MIEHGPNAFGTQQVSQLSPERGFKLADPVGRDGGWGAETCNPPFHKCLRQQSLL